MRKQIKRIVAIILSSSIIAGSSVPASAGFFDSIGDKLGDAWDATTNVAGDIWDSTTDVAGNVWDKTTDVASDVWEKTTSVASDAWNATSVAASKAFGAIKNAGSIAWDKIGQSWNSLSMSTKEFMSNSAESINLLYEDVKVWLAESGSNSLEVVQGAFLGLGSKFGITPDTLVHAWNYIMLYAEEHNIDEVLIAKLVIAGIVRSKFKDTTIGEKAGSYFIETINDVLADFDVSEMLNAEDALDEIEEELELEKDRALEKAEELESESETVEQKEIKDKKK